MSVVTVFDSSYAEVQVLEMTGNRFLGDYTSDEQEYMALTNSRPTYTKQAKAPPTTTARSWQAGK